MHFFGKWSVNSVWLDIEYVYGILEDKLEKQEVGEEWSFEHQA